MPTLAQRCQSATSRSSCTFGISAACAALSRLHDLFVVPPRRAAAASRRAPRACRAARARPASARGRRARRAARLAADELLSSVERFASRVRRSSSCAAVSRAVTRASAAANRAASSGPPSTPPATSFHSRRATAKRARARRRYRSRPRPLRAAATSSARRHVTALGFLARERQPRPLFARGPPRPVRRAGAAAASSSARRRSASASARALGVRGAGRGSSRAGPFAPLQDPERGGAAFGRRGGGGCRFCAARSSISRTSVRARLAARLVLRARGNLSSSARSVSRSTASSAGSLNSLFSATARISR